MTPNLPATNLPVRQQMLAFAYLAYTGEGLTVLNNGNKINSIIEQEINAALPLVAATDQHGIPVTNILNGWQIDWGPVNYTVPGALYQQNMVYIVKNNSGSIPLYAIAIRGTNFISEVDWLLEDFNVANTMPWPIPGAISNGPAGMAVSESTSIDLNILLGDAMSDNGNGILSYLSSQIISGGPIAVCVTGHSLGGVLSNTLALYLLENQAAWDSTGKSTVSCISFAAPSGGNAAYANNANNVFANAFNSNGGNGNGSFPGWDVSITSNLDNVACTMDAAPLFWDVSNIYNTSTNAAGPLFAIYGNNINFENVPTGVASAEWSAFQSIVLSAMAGALATQQYTQIAVQPIAGVFTSPNLSLPTIAPTESLSVYLDAFTAQAAWQHSNSYAAILGVPCLFDPAILNRNLPAAAGSVMPVITDISPDSTDRLHPFGVQITINGTGFNGSNMFGNMIVFLDSTNQIPYEFVSAGETQLVLNFYPDSLNTGTQQISVSTTSPFYTSNAVIFTIT
jgi:hypothetical protein